MFTSALQSAKEQVELLQALVYVYYMNSCPARRITELASMFADQRFTLSPALISALPRCSNGGEVSDMAALLVRRHQRLCVVLILEALQLHLLETTDLAAEALVKAMHGGGKKGGKEGGDLDDSTIEGVSVHPLLRDFPACMDSSKRRGDLAAFCSVIHEKYVDITCL